MFEIEIRTAIIHDVNEGIGDNSMAKALAAYRGRESTYQKISERFFWYAMIEDIKEYIKTCGSCQQQGKIFKKISPELKSIPVPNEVMKQIGIDLCTLPEVDGFKHLIVCIDYFSKWSEAKAVKDKSAPTVAKFLYEIICRHGCMRIQINDQGKEFVNEVSENLHEMTGTEQRITSAYHPQSNGLCERQNRTIKDSLVKVLEEKPKEWPNIIDGILFAHRVSIHYSTKYLPFFLMYNRHPILPIDIKYDLIDNNADKEPESNPYDITTFQAVLESAALIREATNEKASQNIKKAQAKHQKDYNNRHSTISTTLPIGSKVLLQNQRRQDRKGGKFSYKWIGPYTIKSISKTGLCVLISEKGFVLKKKYNVSLLKPYNSKADSDPPEEINEKDQESDKDRQQQTAGKNLFDKLPDEILEMILMNVTKSHAIDAFYSISRTCKRFQSVIEGKKDEILPMVHINFPENVFQNLPRRANKIKVSVKKLSKFFGSCSGVIECVSKAIGKKTLALHLVINRKAKT